MHHTVTVGDPNTPLLQTDELSRKLTKKMPDLTPTQSGQTHRSLESSAPHDRAHALLRSAQNSLPKHRILLCAAQGWNHPMDTLRYSEPSRALRAGESPCALFLVTRLSQGLTRARHELARELHTPGHPGRLENHAVTSPERKAAQQQVTPLLRLLPTQTAQGEAGYGCQDAAVLEPGAVRGT